MVCGIILSGGLSRRFQSPNEPWIDKALYVIDGKPMIVRIYESLKAIVDSAIIAVNNEDRAKRYREVVPEAKYVIDNEPFKGPLAGIYSGIRACNDDYVVVIPNDMPFITPNAIELLVKELSSFDAVTYILPNGHISNALMALRRDVAIPILNKLAELGRSKSFDLLRGAPKVLFMNPLTHGVDAKSLVNINTRDDVTNEPRLGEVVVRNDVSIVRDFRIDDITDLRVSKLIGSLWYTIATGDYIPEFRLYAESGVQMLVAHVLLDSRNENVRALGRRILDALGVEKA